VPPAPSDRFSICPCRQTNGASVRRRSNRGPRSPCRQRVRRRTWSAIPQLSLRPMRPGPASWGATPRSPSVARRSPASTAERPAGERRVVSTPPGVRFPKAGRWVHRDHLRPAQGSTGPPRGPLAVGRLILLSFQEIGRKRGVPGSRGVQGGSTEGVKGVTRGSCRVDTLKSGQLQPIRRKVSTVSRRGQRCHWVSQGVKPTHCFRGPLRGGRLAAWVEGLGA